jgi:hypothetical protein
MNPPFEMKLNTHAQPWCRQLVPSIGNPLQSSASA